MEACWRFQGQVEEEVWQFFGSLILILQLICIPRIILVQLLIKGRRMNGGLRGSMGSQIQRTTMFLKQLRLKLRHSVPWLCTRSRCPQLSSSLTKSHNSPQDPLDKSQGMEGTIITRNSMAITKFSELNKIHLFNFEFEVTIMCWLILIGRNIEGMKQLEPLIQPYLRKRKRKHKC